MKQAPTLGLAVLLLAGTVLPAATMNFSGKVNTDWNNTGNWFLDDFFLEPAPNPPGVLDIASFRGGLFSAAVLGNSTEIYRLRLGMDATGGANPPTLSVVSGAELRTTDYAYVGYSFAANITEAEGILNLDGGSLFVGDRCFVGHAGGATIHEAIGTINMTNGQLTVTEVLTLGMRGTNTTYSKGTVIVGPGSTLTGNDPGVSLIVGNFTEGIFTLDGGNAILAGNVTVANNADSMGTVNLLAGNLDCVTLNPGEGTALINVGQGYLTMDASKVSLVDEWVAAGKIAAIGAMADDSAFVATYTNNLKAVQSGAYYLKYGYSQTTETTAVWAATTSTVGETWAGYPVGPEGYADTTPWLAWLYVRGKPWIWSVTLGKYLYIQEQAVGPGGGWVYIPRNP